MKFTKTAIISRKGFQSLPQRLLLKHARLIDPTTDRDEVTDILLEDGAIAHLGRVELEGFQGQILDLTGKIVTPGWMDMHVHLREPGREDEETIECGALAAANGGFTALCCMPNTDPPIDSQEIIQYIKDRSADLLVAVHPIAAITKKREGKELSEILELVEQGAVAISDDGSPVMNAEVMRRALEYTLMVGVPVIGHEEDATMTDGAQINEGFVSTCLGLRGWPTVAEDIMVARDILLAEYTGGHFHVAHISSAGAVELVRQAKARGVNVTAEVTPHHFTLTDEAVRGYDTNTKMNPPLRSEEDRQALLQGLADGTIDVIATDHAPHAYEEKEAEYIYAPFGIIGLETALGLSVTQLVKTGLLSWRQLIEKLAVNPYRVVGLEPPTVQPGRIANLTIFDPEAQWPVDPSKFLSKSRNTPFAGQTLTGKPVAVINKGKMLFSIL